MVTISRLTTLLSFGIALAGVLPLWPWLDLLPRLAVVMGVLAGWLQERFWRLKFSAWQLNLLLLSVFGWYAVQYSRSNPIQPVVSMVVVMLSARLAGEKSARNLAQLNLLALICLASRSLYDLSPQFLFWLALLALLIPVSLVLLTFYVHDQTLSLKRNELIRVLSVALCMTLVTVPMTAVLFPILPRTAFPLWNLFASNPEASAGLSDKVEPGTYRTAGTSHRLAFRAEVLRQPQPPYWRGIVLNRVTAAGWSRQTAVPHEVILPDKQLVQQTIYPEPSASNMLLGLDAVTGTSLPRIRMMPDLVFEYPRSMTRRMSYTVFSSTAGVLRTAGTIQRSFYQQVPVELSPQIQQLARQIRQQGRTDAERLALAEQFFQQGGYRYSKTNLPTGPDALDQFLFNAKQGHCEFFASSLALLLRAAGVPTRVVGGYLGGDFNQMGGYYQVTEDQAHTWVEVYIAGTGWVRTDPSRFAINADQLWNQQQKPGLFARLRLLLDMLDYRWNRAVVSYDFERQVAQVRAVGSQLQRFEQSMSRQQLIYACMVLVLLLVPFMLKKTGVRLWKSREERLLKRFRNVVSKRFGDAVLLDNCGLFEIAAAVGDQRLVRFASGYGAAVYQDRRLSRVDAAALHALLDELASEQPSVSRESSALK